jgi:hypothetical protein
VLKFLSACTTKLVRKTIGQGLNHITFKYLVIRFE